jgi:hypothetical protein
MRDKHYKPFSFRLNESTIKKLRNLKKQQESSWNLLFVQLIKIYERKKYTTADMPDMQK